MEKDGKAVRARDGKMGPNQVSDILVEKTDSLRSQFVCFLHLESHNTHID